MYVCVSLVGKQYLEQGGLCMYTYVQYLYENSSYMCLIALDIFTYQFAIYMSFLSENTALREANCGCIHDSNTCLALYMFRMPVRHFPRETRFRAYTCVSCRH